MASKNPPKASAKRPKQTESPKSTTPQLLKKVADQLGKSKRLREGQIVVRLHGPEGGDFCLDCGPKSVKLMERLPNKDNPPLLEIIGDASAIQNILENKADPVAQFLRGHFRVRGDLQLLSELAMEFKFIKQPL